MAERRMVSKSISSNERLGAVSKDANIIFDQLIPWLDREGRCKGSPRWVRKNVVQARDDISVEDTEAALRALDEADLILWYRVGDELFIHCPTFFFHQRGAKLERESPSNLPSHIGAERMSGRAMPGESPRPEPRRPKAGGSTAPAAPEASAAAERRPGTPTKGAGAPPAYSAGFEAAWAMYPKRPNNPKKGAWDKWCARVAEGATEAELTAAVERYARFCEAEETTGTSRVMQATTFFGPGERWKDAFEIAHGGPRSPIRDRARVLFALCKRYGLLALPPSEGAHHGGKIPEYKAKVSMAEQDSDAGADLKAELALARPWDGILGLGDDRAMEDEIARRMGWKAPGPRAVAMSGAEKQRATVLRTVGNAALAAAATGLEDEEAQG